MHSRFRELADRLPPTVHALLIDRVEPSTVPLAELVSALGGEATGPTTLRSLQLLRVAKGQPPEAPVTRARSSHLTREPGLLCGESCAVLRAAVDSHARRTAERCSEAEIARGDLAEHLFSRQFSTSLPLTRLQLTELIGAEAVRALWALPSMLPQAEPAGDLCSDSDPDDVEISVRRYTPERRPWIPFHNDRADASVNVALSADERHQGGHLLAVYDGSIHQLVRAEGEATAHSPEVLHAVTQIESGVRYSLIIVSSQGSKSPASPSPTLCPPDWSAPWPSKAHASNLVVWQFFRPRKGPGDR